MDRPPLRDARTPGVGGIGHSGPSPDVGRAELSPGRKADDRLEILLFRRAGREGTPDVLAAAGGPRRAGVAARQNGPAARRPAASGDRSVPGRHRDRLGAQLWTALPASPGAAGDRLDLSNGRGCDREAGNSPGMASLVDRVGSGGTSPGRCGRSSVRADLLQRPGRWSARWATHPLRLEPGLGPGAQGAGPSPVRGARVSQPDTLLLRRYRPGLLRRGGYGPHRECRRRSISTASNPDRENPLPGGFCFTPVGAVGTARVFSKTGFDRTLPDDR